MTLTQVSPNVHLYRGGVNFAVITAPDKRLILVDSGLDSSGARKALRPFLDQGFELAAILNTHSHSDHIGGNADLVKRTGCKVYAPARERPFILWPELEPLGLYGGAAPPPALQVKFLQAQPTPAVLELPAAPGLFELEGRSLELIPLPGHSFDQVAVSFEGVLIAADGLFKPEVIEKHPIIFLVNVADYLAGLDQIAERPERLILPGHGDWIDRTGGEGDPLASILQFNRDALTRLQDAILDGLAEPASAETVLHRVAGSVGKVHENEPQYFLDRAAISAHLTYLINAGRIEVFYQAGQRLIRRMVGA